MTEIGFKSGNVILLGDAVKDIAKGIKDVLKGDKASDELWLVCEDRVLNVTEIEYVREVKVGQSPE